MYFFFICLTSYLEFVKMIRYSTLKVDSCRKLDVVGTLEEEKKVCKKVKKLSKINKLHNF